MNKKPRQKSKIIGFISCSLNFTKGLLPGRKLIIYFLIIWPLSGAILPIHLLTGAITPIAHLPNPRSATTEKQINENISTSKTMATLYLLSKLKYKTPGINFKSTDPKLCTTNEENWLFYSSLKVTCTINGMDMNFYTSHPDIRQQSYPALIYAHLKNTGVLQ